MNLNIFRPEDFDGVAFNGLYAREVCANLAAAHLTQWLKENGKRVYGDYHQTEWRNTIQDERQFKVISSNFKNSYYQALLIAIEPIKKCEHGPKLVKQLNWIEPKTGYNPGLRVHDQVIFECECGARVEPTSFKEVEK